MRGENWKKVHISICSCKDLDTSDKFAVFVALVVSSDLHGRYYADPERIKANCFHFQKDINEVKILAILADLQAKNMIQIYESDGKQFLYIVNHEKYNPAGARKAGKSMFPDPDIIVELQIDKPSDVKPKRVKEAFMGNFDEAWQAYHRKEGRHDAERHYRAQIHSPEDHERLMQAIENYKAYTKFTEKKFIKQGSTFFNHDWEDYVEVRQNEETDIETPQQKAERMKNLQKLAQAERNNQIKQGRLVENMTPYEIKLFNEHSKISYDEAYAKANSPEFQKQVDMLANKFRV